MYTNFWRNRVIREILIKTKVEFLKHFQMLYAD